MVNLNAKGSGPVTLEFKWDAHDPNPDLRLGLFNLGVVNVNEVFHM